MRDGEHASPNARRPAGRLRVGLSLLAVVVALLACGQSTAVTLTHAPASVLKLEIWLEANPNQQTVVVRLDILDASTGSFVNLRNGQKITCNGVEFPHGSSGLFGNRSAPDPTALTLPLPPVGGAYTFVYTDESGAQTSVVVPAERPELVSPHDGDTVPIPQPHPGAVGTPTPTEPPATAGATPTSGPRSPDQVASLGVRFSQSPLPAGAIGGEAANALWAVSSCPDPNQCDIVGPCKRPNDCGELTGATPAGPASNATSGTLTISDSSTPIGEGFESFPAGPGMISLFSSFRWDQPTSDFAAVQVHADTRIDAHITWVRS